MHHTPTYGSWLNQAEIWFNLITRGSIRQGAFKGVQEPRSKVNEYTQRYSQHPEPFVWTAMAG
jgi:hypothetical protein